MKTIEEAAREYAEKLNYSMEAKHNMCPMDFEISFKKGIAFAEEWISVEEELPINQDIVFVKTDLGCVTIAYLHGKKSGFIVYGEDAYIEFGNITHWRPINRK